MLHAGPLNIHFLTTPECFPLYERLFVLALPGFHHFSFLPPLLSLLAGVVFLFRGWVFTVVPSISLMSGKSDCVKQPFPALAEQRLARRCDAIGHLIFCSLNAN